MKLVVVGGDAAGMSAASQARRRRGPDELEIVAFERGHFTPYSACGIPYWIGGVVSDRDRLITRDPATFRTDHAIDARVRHEVIGIDLDRREVAVRDLDAGRDFREGFDELVYAAGAVPVRPDWANVDAAGVFGVELAEALVRRGLSVTLLERAAQPMSTVDRTGLTEREATAAVQ